MYQKASKKNKKLFNKFNINLKIELLKVIIIMIHKYTMNINPIHKIFKNVNLIFKKFQ